MKKTKIFTAMMAALVCNAASAQTIEFGSTQKAAQQSIIQYLDKVGERPQLDKRDQSVVVEKNKDTYWITIEGNSDPLLYTIHVQSNKFDDPKRSKESKQRTWEIAEKAANALNAKSPAKAVFKNAKVEFIYPVYCSNADAFNKIYKQGMEAVTKIKKNFRNAYDAAKIKVDSIHNYWYGRDTSCVIVPQPVQPAEQAAQQTIQISNYDRRVVDAAGNQISGYGNSIHKAEAKYIQFKITYTSSVAGTTKIGLKIYTPNGKVLLPSKDASYSTITTIISEKNKKPVTYEAELVKFGSDKNDLWKAGDYKVEFYEDGKLLKSGTFSII